MKLKDDATRRVEISELAKRTVFAGYHRKIWPNLGKPEEGEQVETAAKSVGHL